MEKKKVSFKALIIILIIISVCLAIDLLTKTFVAEGMLKNKPDILLIPYLINLTYVENTGAAFGLFSGNLIFLIIITIVFIIVFACVFIYFNSNNTWFIMGYAFIFSGAIGNFIDRLFLGYVRDFIQLDFFKSFPIFNFADFFLTLGIICMGIYFIVLTIKENKEKAKDKNNG